MTGVRFPGTAGHFASFFSMGLFFEPTYSSFSLFLSLFFCLGGGGGFVNKFFEA